MKRLFILFLILLSLTTKAQIYNVLKIETSIKTFWDLDFVVESSKVVRGAKVNLFFFGMTDVYNRLYLFRSGTCSSEYKNGKLIKTSWLAYNKKGEKYKIVYTPNVVRIIYSDDGILLSTDYYIK